jgi:hypothetical protein
MTRAPLTITPGALAAEALKIMNERRITVLFVVEARTARSASCMSTTCCGRGHLISPGTCPWACPQISHCVCGDTRERMSPGWSR